MSELKVYHCNEWHNEYTEFYKKYEVDIYIARKNLKQCEAMVIVYHLHMLLTCNNPESILFKRSCKRHKKYLELAEHYRKLVKQKIKDMR